MRIVGYIILGIYHAFIVIPMFYIIPQSLVVACYLYYEKKPNRQQIRHFLVVSALTFLITTCISHFYFKTRGIVNYLESFPLLNNPLTLILMLYFAVIPLIPILAAYYINKRIYKKKQRKLFYFSTAYFFYAFLLLFFLVRNTVGAHSLTEIITKPLLIPNLVNFTEIFDVFGSTVFHEFLHFLF